jgi:uncharacterized protein (TIGR02594 family)
MVTCLPKASDYAANQTITPEAFGSAYKYDQLNRLSSSRVFTNINTTTNQWQSGASTNPSAYATDYTYDAMGNILTQKRNGGGTSATALDELTYNYHTTTDGLVSNRLYQVNDVVSAGNYTDDIDDQGTFNNTHSTIETANNYGYDELGNLVRDAQEEIASIEWTVYGKMKKITRNSSSSKADLEFGYDASGNRLWKKVTPKGSGAVISTYYYLRDAQGNEMCRYVKYTNTTSQLMYVAQEHSIYGSSRVGVDNRKDTLYLGAVYTTTWGGVGASRRELGLKSFELANHLGNVLVTVSDKPIYKVSSATIYFQPEITSSSDYYPFGAPMAGRSFSSTEYRFGFNTQEKDDEVNGTGNSLNYKFRMHDTRLGRFFAVDPLTKDYPWYTPYQFSGNKVIHCIELEGLEEWEVNNIDGGKTKTYGPWKDQETAQSQETINEVKTDTRFNFLKVAGNQIGTTETPGSGLNPKITEYHKTGGRYNGTENDAWCASFVNYCLAKGNPEYPRTNSPASNSFYIGATKLQVERVAVPYYGSFMVRSNDGNFNGGQGHVALVVGQVGLGYAQLGGNQAVPGSSSGTTVNVVLREPANNVRYYHYTFLPKVPLSTPLFQTATKVTAKQLGNDR